MEVAVPLEVMASGGVSSCAQVILSFISGCLPDAGQY